MAMYEEQGRGTNRGMRGNEGMTEQLEGSSRLEQQRRDVERLAQTLSQQSMQQWQRAAEGIVALPAAIAVGFAATTLYIVGFVTRGFQALQQQADESSRQMRISFEEQQGRGEGRLEGRGEQRQRGENRAPDAAIENQPRA
ncbi:MAG: hypothetical protein JWN44_4679 [Myxococcales bacterium]|nr:hypothetical protein [Myxococcales bacterium]